MKTAFSMIFALALVGCANLGQISNEKSDLNRQTSSVSPTSQFCNVAKDWKLGTLSPEELCRKYEGSFCSSMKTFGQSICASNKKPFCSYVKSDGEGICRAGDGSFCDGLKTTAGGICAALKGPFCSDEVDEIKWNKKLVEACAW
jgi:hypothetical protein